MCLAYILQEPDFFLILNAKILEYYGLKFKNTTPGPFENYKYQGAI